MWQRWRVLRDATKNYKKTHFYTSETSFFFLNLLESKYLNEINNIFKNGNLFGISNYRKVA